MFAILRSFWKHCCFVYLIYFSMKINSSYIIYNRFRRGPQDCEALYSGTCISIQNLVLIMTLFIFHVSRQGRVRKPRHIFRRHRHNTYALSYKSAVCMSQNPQTLTQFRVKASEQLSTNLTYHMRSRTKVRYVCLETRRH